MKGLKTGLVVAGLLMAGVGAAHAQSPVSFGLGGGATIPLGSTSDAVKTGWHGLALVQFKPAGSPVGFQIDGQYQELKSKAGLTAGKTQLINGTANVVFSFPVAAETKVRPYLIGGGGVYNIKFKPSAGGASPSSTKFGLNAGAGFDFALSGATIFVEGRYHNVFVTGSDTKFIPITLGVKFGGK
ncbi:MAG TPA: outer membrane beta-barrel protein [Gemmatimonadales bacterium]|nr:outer membrane beta-barrel protein [Gemmatimonadales bacterium]